MSAHGLFRAMVALFIVGCILHLCALAVAIHFWMSKTPWLIVLSQLLLGFYLVSLWSLIPAQGGGAFGFALFGPYLGPFVLLHAASAAPSIGYWALLIGAVSGLSAGILASRSKPIRIATLAGQAVFALVAWGVAEAAVVAALQSRAAEQFPAGYCIVNRASVLKMIEYGLTDEWVFGTHATLVDGANTYAWSFSRMSFLLQSNANYIESNPSLDRCR